MTEKEMEDLLWNYPDRFFREKLTPFRRQPSSTIGRADLVFTDDRGDLLVVEIKIGRLGRKEMIEVMGQLRDYYGLMKNESPKKAVDLMLVAHDIPRETHAQPLAARQGEFVSFDLRRIHIDRPG